MTDGKPGFITMELLWIRIRLVALKARIHYHMATSSLLFGFCRLIGDPEKRGR